jgi:glyoxylase-like metal-dependent hydrolase (beta-lactamase superfamily II)
VLLSADHILPEISPHQAPESIMPYTGLGHYLESLEKIGRMGGFDMALGGHEGPISDVYKRVAEIRKSHERKLEKVLTIIRESPDPLTINEISEQLYTRVKGFHILLALEEVAAHVEYLYQHGKLTIANLDDYQREENPAISYVVA